MRCERFEETLRDDDLQDELKEHAEACDECASLLNDFATISAAAKEIGVPPASDRFRERVLEATAAELESSRETRSTAILSAVAALLLLAIGFAAVWSQIERGPDPLDEWVVRNRALEDVERSEEQYRESIDRLANAIGEIEEGDASPRLVALQEKLLVLDQAIAECESVVEDNPYHAGLRQQLLTIYQEKDETLREVLEARQQ